MLLEVFGGHHLCRQQFSNVETQPILMLTIESFFFLSGSVNARTSNILRDLIRMRGGQICENTYLMRSSVVKGSFVCGCVRPAATLIISGVTTRGQ